MVCSLKAKFITIDAGCKVFHTWFYSAELLVMKMQVKCENEKLGLEEREGYLVERRVKCKREYIEKRVMRENECQFVRNGEVPDRFLEGERKHLLSR